MAQFFKSSSGEIQQYVMIQAEEAAAVGVNFVQQQPPPSQQVVHFTTYQPHIHQSPVYQLAGTVHSPVSEYVNVADSDHKVKVQLPLQRKALQNVALQQQQFFTSVQQAQLKAVTQQEHIQKFHLVQQTAEPSVASNTDQLPNQTVVQVSPVASQSKPQCPSAPKQSKPKVIQQVKVLQLKNTQPHITQQLAQQLLYEQQQQQLRLKQQVIAQKPQQQQQNTTISVQQYLQRRQQLAAQPPGNIQQQIMLQPVQQNVPSPKTQQISVLQPQIVQQKLQQPVQQQVALQQVQQHVAVQQVQQQIVQENFQQQTVQQSEQQTASLQQEVSAQQNLQQQVTLSQVQQQVVQTGQQLLQPQANLQQVQQLSSQQPLEQPVVQSEHQPQEVIQQHLEPQQEQLQKTPQLPVQNLPAQSTQQELTDVQQQQLQHYVVQEAMTPQHQQQGVVHIQTQSPRTINLKQLPSQVQQGQQHVGGQQTQMILIQPTQQPSPQQRLLTQTPHHVMQRFIQPLKNQQPRLVRPGSIGKNQRYATPLILKRFPQNQTNSHQAVMMMHAAPGQVSLQHVTQVPVQQTTQTADIQCNGVTHPQDVPSSSAVASASPQSNQAQQIRTDTNQVIVTKSSPVTPKVNNSKKKSNTVKHIPANQQATHTVLASNDVKLQAKVPTQFHSVLLQKPSNQGQPVNNVSAATQIPTDRDATRSQSANDAQCQTVSLNNESQVPKSVHLAQQTTRLENSNQYYQLALTQQQLQVILQRHSIALQKQQASSQIDSSSASPLKLIPTALVDVQQNSKSDVRHSSDLAAQTNLNSEMQSTSSVVKKELGVTDSMVHMIPLQGRKNFIVDTDIFLNKLVDGKNYRVVVHPGGCTLQQVAPSVVEQTTNEGHVTVIDGMEVKDEFPTGEFQECVVSESGEVIIANPSTIKSEPESTENTSIVVKEEPADASEFQTNNGRPNLLIEEHKIPSSSDSMPDTNYVPKYVNGMLAVCSYCGYVSSDFNRCERCLRKLSENVRTTVDHSRFTISTKGAIPNGTTAITPMTSVSSVLVKKTLCIPAEKLTGRLPKPEHSLHGTVVISPDKRKTKAANRRTRSKVPDEPEILTLSSDDEDKEENKSACESSSSVKKKLSEALDLEARAIAESEEMDSLDQTIRHFEGVEGGGMMEQAVDGSIDAPHVMIQCRTIRIGSFKQRPSDRVLISPQGIEIKLPASSDSAASDIRVVFKLTDIKRVLACFDRKLVVLFIYMRDEGAAKIRETLNMTDPNGAIYFDPSSPEETYKRITLLPEKLAEEMKHILNRVFKSLMTEVVYKIANEILVKSSPVDETLRHPGRNERQEIKTIMVYPPPPAKGGISINTEDYGCLGEDQFLNDVIIDFYLKYLMQSVLSEEDRERTHVFSSFFYKRLTSRPKTKGRRHPIEDDPKLSSAQKRHARVKSWTKNVNIFSKDFIIIPINESSHWFLAIICFPGEDGCRRMCDNAPIDPQILKSPPAAVAAAAAAVATTNSKLRVQNNVMSIGSTTITPVKASAPATITLDHNGDEGSDRDEAEGDEEEMEEPVSDEEPQEPVDSNVDMKTDQKEVTSDPSGHTNSLPRKVKEREEIKQPCILIFDSLVGAPRYRVVATLRDYLSIEYKFKESKEKEFTKDTIKGMLPKVPQQTNFTDCGLYVLQYVESFFKNPIKDYHYPIKELQQWFPEEVVTRKREEIVHLLHDLMSQQGIDTNSLPLPELSFSHNSALAQEQQAETTEAISEHIASHSYALVTPSQQQSEDTEAADRLAASMNPDYSVEDGRANTSAGENNEKDDSENLIMTAECDEAQDSESDHLFQDVTSKSSVCSVIKHRPDMISETCSVPTQKESLVDYSESSDDSSSDQATIKRGSELDDTTIDKKKRKCSNE